ncbi:MAG: hypothetical protein KGS46_19035, partial [Chloroflexi bacterium]|nr:hypothetical protein [Chloroflexota bacterium]
MKNFLTRWFEQKPTGLPAEAKPAPAPNTGPTATLTAAQILNSTVVNAATVHMQVTPPPPISATYTLPTVTKPFFGRKAEIAQLRQRLAQPGMVNLTSLKGAGGMGKSALALHMAHTCADLFPDGRHWLDLRSDNPSLPVRDLLQKLGITGEALNANFAVLCGLLQAQLHGKRALLVLDNAEGLAQHNLPALRALCLPSPAVTLITSRSQIQVGRDIEVGRLETADALALLAYYGVDLAAQSEAAQALITRLGGLALAVDIAARRMVVLRQNCAQALAELQSGIDKLKAVGQNSTADDNLTVAFGLSYERLDAPLREAFWALGLCAPTPNGSPLAGIAAMLEIGEDATGERLAALSALSLAELAPPRADLHPLLRDYARAQASQQPAQTQGLVERHARYFGQHIGAAYQNAIQAEQDRSAALQQMDDERDNLTLAQTRCLQPNFAAPILALEITNNLQQYWRLRDEPQQLSWLQRANVLVQQTGAKQGQANVLKAIGDVQAFQKENAAALESYRLAQALFNQTGAKLGQANVLKAIGDVQAFQDDRAAALESYRLAQALYDQTGA